MKWKLGILFQTTGIYNHNTRNETQRVVKTACLPQEWEAGQLYFGA